MQANTGDEQRRLDAETKNATMGSAGTATI